MAEIDLGEPRENEVLFRVVATGICHSDLAVRDGDLPLPTPIVLGHEGSGVVERVGSAVTRVKEGDHVMVTFASCGTCRMCATGHPGYCLNFAALNLTGTRPDGTTGYSRDRRPLYGHFVGQSSFATYALAPERAVVKVPDDAPLDLLAPIGCGIQTGAGSVMNNLRPEAGSSIAVLGTGSVGLSAIMAAKVVGCTPIIAVDLHPERLTLARELGATHTIDSRQGTLTDGLAAITGGLGVDYILDSTAAKGVIEEAIGSLAVRGVMALVGVSPPEVRIEADPMWLVAGRTVTGIMVGDPVPELFIPYLLSSTPRAASRSSGSCRGAAGWRRSTTRSTPSAAATSSRPCCRWTPAARTEPTVAGPQKRPGETPEEPRLPLARSMPET